MIGVRISNMGNLVETTVQDGTITTELILDKKTVKQVFWVFLRAYLLNHEVDIRFLNTEYRVYDRRLDQRILRSVDEKQDAPPSSRENI